MSTHVLLRFSPTISGERDAWRDEGRCAKEDPALFFPSQGSPVLPAKRVCAVCPVVEQCLEYALENNERFGVWGGTSESERASLGRARRREGEPIMVALRARVVELHAEGQNDARIAKELGCARTTVNQIRRELDLPSIRSLAGRARRAS